MRRSVSILTLEKIIPIVILIFIPNVSYAQIDKQESTLLGYNVAFGGLSSGIGAIINKKKDANWKHAFVKGFWQGCTGGALHYAGKKSLFLINKKQNLLYAWPAKILHSAGSSIIENAGHCKP